MVSAREPFDGANAGIGKDGEVSEWLRPAERVQGEEPRSMTLWDAADHHCRTWGFPSRQNPDHEVAHVIYALAQLHDKGAALHPYDYQGSYKSESVVLAIETILRGIGNNRGLVGQQGRELRDVNNFVAKIYEYYDYAYGHETFNAAMTWRIAQQRIRRGLTRGVTYDEIRRECQYYSQDLERIARQEGIPFTIKRIGANNDREYAEQLRSFGFRAPEHIEREKEAWIIDSGDPENPYRSALRGYVAEHLPQGSNGAYDFVPFERPKESDLRSLYGRLAPVFGILERYVAQMTADGYTGLEPDFDEMLYGVIPVSEIHDAMGKAGPRPTLLSHLMHRIR